MAQEYVLRLYDTYLLTFSLSEHGIEGLRADIHEINRAERSRFPLDMEACLEYYEKLGPEAYEEIKSMLVFDAVIYNEDRHFGNFGVLRDNHSGALLGAAPVFDNGLSLFNFAMPKDWKDLDSYAKTRGTACGIGFENVCQEIMGPVQTRQLRGLLGFTFQRHPRLNLPEERLTAIERHVQKRVRQLLELTPVREKTKKRSDRER